MLILHCGCCIGFRKIEAVVVRVCVVMNLSMDEIGYVEGSVEEIGSEVSVRGLSVARSKLNAQSCSRGRRVE